MSLKKERFIKGIILAPDSTALESIEGEIKVDSATGKIQVTLKDGANPSASREIITSSQNQTLTNKTLDVDNNIVSNIETDNLKAGVLNVSGTLSAASDTQVPSALAAKTYSDSVASTAASNLSSHASTSSGVHGVTGSIVGTSDSQALTNKTIDADLNTISNIENADIKAGAAIDASKLADGSVSNTEFQYLGNVTSDIQTQINSKEPSFATLPVSKGGTNSSTALNNNRVIQSSGGAIVEAAAITASRAIVSDANGIPTHSAVSTTTLEFLDATSSVQTQINSKVNASGGTLTNGSIVTPVRSDVKQDTKANLTTYALTASNGQLVFATDTKEMFQVVDTLLVAVGGGEGIGGVDILFTQTFETAALTDFTQTGLSLSTSDPLHGEISALLTHQAAINQSFKQVIPVDRKFRGETMTLRLNAKSNASAGNVTINIYDETNAANLVASEQLELSNDTSGAISRVGFTIPETCASISYTITALPEAGSPVTRIDDIICELAETALLETAVEVPVVTAWQGYTPTFQGFGTPTNVEFEWRQVGENVEIRGKFVSGTSTAVEARVGLPAGLTSAGTSLIPSIQVVGKGSININSTTNFGEFSTLIEPSVSYITLASIQSTNNGLNKQNASSIASSGNTLSFFASVPCSGLSATTTKTIPLTQSGLVQEADSMIYAAGNGGQAITVNVTDIPFTAISSEGNDISFNGSSVTALSNGIYSFDIGILFTTSLARRVSIYVNNAVIYETASATDTSLTSNITLKLNSGDIVKFRVSGNGGTLNNASQFHYLSVTKQGSLKQVSVNPNSKITIPTSELRMEGASSRGSTATAIVRFDNVAKIRGDAFTVESDAVLGTRITMKKAGKLTVGYSLTTAQVATQLTKNQSILTGLSSTSSEILAAAYRNVVANGDVSASWSGFVNVGDIIRVCANGNPAANAINNLNLSFQEQEIQVSVTNTLPQFSESDLVVKAAGNSGQVITAGVTDIPFQTSFDSTGGAWNGSQFVVQEDGTYNISASAYFTNAANRNLELNINGSPYRRLNSTVTDTYCQGSLTDYFTKGQVLSIKVLANGGTLSNLSTVHYLNITKVGKPNVTGVDVTPFVNVPQPDSEFINKSGAGVGSTNTNIVTFNNNTFKNTLGSKGILSYSNSSTLGDSFTALKKCTVRVSFSCSTLSLSNAGYEARLLKNDITGAPSSTLSYSIGIISSGAGPEVDKVSLQGSYQLEAGDVLRFFVASSAVFNLSGTTFMSIEAEALSDQILTAPETFSTDTAALVYAPSSTYTLSTLSNAPVGTYITFTYAANTNTRTQTTTRPTQTDADMNANGIQIFTRAYNAASTSGNPSAIAIQIGKGLKGKSLNLYKSAGKVTVGSLDLLQQNATVLLGVSFKEYNEVTGILYVDVGLNNLTSTTNSTLFFSDLTTQTSGYLVISASKNPSLVGIGLNRVAARATSTAGGAIGTANTLQTFAEETFDTNGAWNGTTFTAPEDGYYQVNCAVLTATVTLATNQGISISLFKNGQSTSISTTKGTGVATTYGVMHSDMINLKKGDTLEIYGSASVATTQTTSAGFNFISISKVSV